MSEQLSTHVFDPALAKQVGDIAIQLAALREDQRRRGKGVSIIDIAIGVFVGHIFTSVLALLIWSLAYKWLVHQLGKP